MHRSSHSSSRLLRTFLCLLFLLPSSFAQRHAHTRTFRIDGSYAAAVTISPQINIIVKSGDTPKITWLNGYERREIAAPEENQYRVYESRTGQLWSLYSDGVLLYYRGQWAYHPIAEVRNEMLTNPMRQLRQISLVPAELNILLILLPDRLLEYDAATGRTTMLKEVAATGLGRFQEMHESQDGGLWVTGINALAYLPGPIRRLEPETEWREQVYSGGGPLLHLQRPYENPPGVVATVGISPEITTHRYVLQLNQGEWKLLPVQSEKARQAWRGWDSSLWSYSYNSLFRVLDQPDPRIVREPVIGAQFDVAVETNGVFWIASGEGLVRYAPHLWRSPPELEFLQHPVHAMLETTNENRLWIVSSDALISLGSSRTQSIPWPHDFEVLFQPSDSIYEVPNGLLAITTQNQPLFFDPAQNAFVNPPVPLLSPWRFVGSFADKSLCAWSPRPVAGASFWKFDGIEFTPMHWEGLELAGDEVTAFRQLARGDIWIGTDAGLALIRASGGPIQYFPPQPDGSPERILSITDVGEDRLWCGTASGIYEYRGQEWEAILTTGERINSIIRGLDGSVWVGSSGGVMRFLENAWIRYTPADGLPSSAIYTVLRDRADEIRVGTGRGVARFHRSADLDPPLALTPALVANERPTTRSPTMITFSGMDKWDYCPPGELLFSYRLDEGPWSAYSNITARTFQNLSSGEHVVELRAMDKAGNRSVESGQLAFSVIVPWFRDPRLIAVSAIGFLAVVFFAGLAVNKHLQLKRSYAEVGKIVEQRTRELEKANQELLHSQKMKAVGTMAAGIAHDFNNILSIIKGSAQIIESNPDNKDKIRTRINRIQTVVEQGSSIVRALLGLGRLNERELAKVDLQGLLEETQRVLSDRVPPGVHLEVHRNGFLPPIRCSREVLQQMLMNLVLNAVDAVGGHGSIRLMADQRPQTPPNQVVQAPPADEYVILSVSDTGCGIPADVLHRIFEPFYTTKAFSSRRGTGLGLSMVYELAKGVGYGLTVSSKLGDGSTFEVIIPVTKESV